MRTIPPILSDYSRGGHGEYVYGVEITPGGADSWLAKRFATASVEIGGNSYEKALAKSITRIVHSARVIRTGAVGVFPQVNVKIIDKDRLHEDIITDNIVNRKVEIKLTAISSNRVLNSSFEKNTAHDFDDWIEVPAGGPITLETVEHYEGSQCIEITSTSGANSYILQSGVEWRVGEDLHISMWVKTGAGSDQNVNFALGVGGLWWTGATWSISFTPINIGVATPGGWTRLSTVMRWQEEWSEFGGGSEENLSVVIGIACDPNEQIWVDAVQVEPLELTDYHHNRYELTEDDTLTAFTGFAKKPVWKNGEITFVLEPFQRNTYRKIPAQVISEDDVSGWSVPNDSVGKPYPITYGDFTGLRPWVQQEPHSFARGILANIDASATDGVVVFFDRKGLHDDGASTYRLYHWHDGAKSYYEQMDYDHASYSYDDQEFLKDLVNGKFKESSNPQFISAGKISLMVHLRARIARSPSNFTDYGNVRDGSLVTFGYTTYVGIAGCSYELELFPYDHKDVMLDSNLARDDLAIFFLGDFYQTADIVAGASDLTVTAVSVSGFKDYLQSEDLWTGETGEVGWSNTPADGRTGAANKNLTEVEASPLAGESVPRAFMINLSIDATGCANHEIRCYELGLLIYVIQPLEETEFAGSIHGRAFGGTWDSRKTSTALVESPAEVVESLVREELDGGNDDIDMTEFDVVDTARASWKTEGQIHDLVEFEKVVNKICEEFGVLYFIDVHGKHTLKTLDYNASTIDTLVLSDFIEPQSKLEISMTPAEMVINSVKIFYNKHQFTGEYMKYAYCNKDGSSGSIGSGYETKCSDSFDAHGENEEYFEMRCDWIKDDATAELLVKWLIDWAAEQRVVLSGDLTMDHLDKEIGDLLSLDLEDYVPSSVTATGVFMVIETRLIRSENRIGIVLLEVKA